MLDALFKPHMDRLWAPLGQLAARAGLAPNTVTGFSLVLCLLNAAAYPLHRNPYLFGLSLLLFEALDNVDGAVARATGNCTALGGYLDAVCDRYKDAAALLAVAWVHDRWLVCSLMLTGALLTGYARARAFEAGAAGDGQNALFERLERIVLLALGLLLCRLTLPFFGVSCLDAALVLGAAGAHVTALQRIVGAMRALRA